MRNVNHIDLNLYAKGKLELHLRKITVTQNGTSDPLVYSGPGTVTLEGGRLQYVLHHTPGNGANSRRAFPRDDGKAGQLITVEDTYRLSAVDMHGQTWTSDEVDAGRHIWSKHGSVIKGYIRCLRSASKPAMGAKSSIHYMLAANRFFPVSSLMPECGFEFEVAGAYVKTEYGELMCEVSVSGKLVDVHFGKTIIQVLEVVTGSLMPVRVVEIYCDNQRWIELHSFRDNMRNSQLPPPIEVQFPTERESLAQFFESVYEFFAAKEGSYYAYWYQLDRTWQGGLEAASLTIGIYIEGILRDYFETLGKDPDFHKIASAALPEIMKLKIPERVLESLKGSIGNAGQFKAKTALYKLTETGAISPDLSKDWGRLRHDAAHGVRAGIDLVAQQRQVDLTFSNLKLFYEIMFHLSGYKGPRIDYATHGFPSGLSDLSTDASLAKK